MRSVESRDMARGAVIRLALTPDAVAEAAASEVLAILESAIAWRGEAHLALSGGRTPAALHRALAARPFDGWPFVHVWFGDERMVPPEHADSNYHMACETLLDAVPVPAAQIHRIEGERDPADAARACAEALSALAARQDGRAPAMDVLLLGMGTDAHTASLFPGSPLLVDADVESAPCAAAVFVPALHAWRVTFTPRTILAARTVCVLVAGADKHPAIRRVLGESSPIADAPASLLLRHPADVAWFIDSAALFG